MRYVVVRHGVPVGELESDRDEGDEISGTVTLHSGADELHAITALAHDAMRNLGYLGGVTDAGDERGRAAMHAWRTLQQEVELYAIDGSLVAEQVEAVSPMDKIRSQLHLRARRTPSGEGGAGIPAKRIWSPAPRGASARPDV